MVFSIWRGKDHYTMVEGIDPPKFANGEPMYDEYEHRYVLQVVDFDEALKEYYELYELDGVMNAVP